MGSATPTDLTQCSATELLALYRRGEASPVEATRAVLERIDTVDPRLNSFCLVAHDAAMESAAASEARWHRGEPMGPLDGVPTSLKDLILTRGWPTRRGSHTVDPDQPWDVDAPATARLREAGAVLIGKTTTPEFGCKGETNSSLTGITRNPWDTSKIAGRLVGRHGSRRGRRAGSTERRHRRRRIGAHPRRVLRQLRAQAELRPRSGVPAVAIRHRVAPRAAHDERGRRGADDERAQATRRSGLDIAPGGRLRLPRRTRRRHRRLPRRLLARHSVTPATSTRRSPPPSPRRRTSWWRSVPRSRPSTRGSPTRWRSRPVCGSRAPGRCGTSSARSNKA